MRRSFLPFAPPSLDREEAAAVAEVLSSDWITTGPRTAEFEQRFAEFVGVPEALALSSGTAALHTALLSFGVGPGDGVVTTAMTFCSTVHVIEHVGAIPILVDVEPDTLNLDPQELRRVLEGPEVLVGRTDARLPRDRIKAVIPVHFGGHPCDMRAIIDLSREHGLVVIEDAAHALPATLHGSRVGQIRADLRGHAVAFSFYATKNLTTAEGGMLTGDADILAEGRVWSLHGISRDAWNRYGQKGSWYYDVTRPGFKYNMTDLQAAIGLQQLRKLPSFHKRRVEIAERYQNSLSSLDAVDVPIARPGVDSAWHLFVLRLNPDALGMTRDVFIEEMRTANIGSGVHFIPIHLHPYYRDKYGYRPDDFPVAYREYQRIVSLPLHPRMEDEDVDDVIAAVQTIARGRARG